jgi:hypothetical protein
VCGEDLKCSGSTLDVRLLSSFATGLMIFGAGRYISLLYKFGRSLLHNTCNFSRSQCPPGLRRGSAAAYLLLLRVRIPSGDWISVSRKCYVVSGREVSATGRSLIKRSPTECGMSERDREALMVRRPWPNRECCTMK